MDKLIELIGISAFWLSVLYASELPYWLDFKPFNCNVCLSMWSAILISLISGYGFMQSLAFAGYAGILSIMLNYLIKYLSNKTNRI